MSYLWKDALLDVGFLDLPDIPNQTCIVHAYKNGEVHTFDNREEARKFSSNYEVVWVSSPERDAIIELRRKVEAEAYDLWYNKLREDWSDINDALFRVCYDGAYERGHSSGYDEVANYMGDIVEFALRVARAMKED